VLSPRARSAGEKYIFTIEEGANGANGRISVNYDGFIDDVSVGDTLLVDGGIMSLKLLAIEGKDVTCQVVDGGVMKSRCARPAWPASPAHGPKRGLALSRPGRGCSAPCFSWRPF
jgi:predicted heme/steroid binding protein